MTDITGRVRAEEERVALHSQLLQAHKMEAMGRLAAGVAHDFNNMLTAVLGYAGMALARVSPDSALYAELAEIEKAGRRSAGLARQLLVFARKQPATPSALSLNDAVASMLKMLARLIGENIHLEWKPGQQSSAVMMDPLQIDRLLANLAVNARDAISGVGTITVVTDLVQVGQEYCARHPGCVPGEYVTLAVSDDGCGMDEETLSHIFEPFFTTKEEGKGTGLGLATVYGIVQQNTGFVDVTSQPGRGTTFTVYFPHLRDCPAHGVAASAATRVPGGTETVLLVEDDPMVLQMGQMMLTGLGYAVLTAQTPAQALQLAAEHNGTIHLLITDVVMPEMNGGDLADKVVSLRPEMKRIYTSGYPADIIAPMGVLDGSEVFVAKPYSRQALADQVREALDRPSGPA
jgi:nitrogen-specific signal transduction histidine kinase/CheY-like chemotaxis protein